MRYPGEGCYAESVVVEKKSGAMQDRGAFSLVKRPAGLINLVGYDQYVQARVSSAEMKIGVHGRS
jgi:hypothetical protein